MPLIVTGVLGVHRDDKKTPKVPLFTKNEVGTTQMGLGLCYFERRKATDSFSGDNVPRTYGMFRKENKRLLEEYR